MYKASLDGVGRADTPEKEWRRSVVRYGLFAAVGVVALYEYALRHPPQHQQLPLPEAVPIEEDDNHGLEFLRELQKAKEEPDPEASVSDAKDLFTEKYADSAKPLLCSGCKLAASRIGEELLALNATGQPDPTALLGVMTQAVQAACEKLPSPLVISRGKRGGAFFGTYQAASGHSMAGVEQRKAEVARRTAQRLCVALLADAKLPMLEALIRRKVPHERRSGPGQAENDNWERWLCARRARLCKRSEVQEDDEDEDEGEL